MLKKIIESQKGYSLFEMVVAVGIFAVVSVSAVGIFQTVVDGQRNAIAAQNIQENFRYALEVMSKELRNAQKDNGVCNTSPINVANSAVYDQNSAAGDIIFKNKYGQCVRYYLSGQRIAIRRDLVIDYITPPEIVINSLTFNLNISPTDQPSVNFVINGYVAGKSLNRQEMRVETSISSRYYE